ncbi:unnamed protein product [Medioppia subpectinata]|uniref:RING-type domain-containing protein n=1 Tax=Medioppia subpectinata TaxID=1979941 RepID=A0A7R9KLM5_9ACAR|nr:unnamed protein product [Medioppia subpectinata]CAG2105869.1 unnamed protein product [Medioppia subpectinata]
MPGYSSDRFPDLSAEDRDEYTCSICHEIFNTPVTTSCCLQTFCDDCITEWLETNNTCPYDRKRLTASELSRASRVLVNTMGRFKIRCDYWDKGCRQVIKFDKLPQHTINCSYNITMCVKCEHVMTSGHDCIESLRAEIAALKLALSDRDHNNRYHPLSIPSTSNAKRLGKSDFHGQLSGACGKLVVVYFYDFWVDLGKKSDSVFTIMCAELANEVLFLKVDVDDNEDIATDHKVSVMPTFILIKNKQKVDELSSTNETKLRQLIRKHM